MRTAAMAGFAPACRQDYVSIEKRFLPTPRQNNFEPAQGRPLGTEHV